jgi:hypothetical protein
MNEAELAEAAALLDELKAPMFDEPAEGLAFWAFYVDDDELDLDEVLERFAEGRGVYAVEVVWDAELNLVQRGAGQVVRAVPELRALRRRARELHDGMEQTRKNLAAASVSKTTPATVKSTGPSSWLAARTQTKAK